MNLNTNEKILVFPDSNNLTNYLVKLWRDTAEESIRLTNRFNVALSGGRSATEFYSRLSGLEDYSLWGKTHLFFGDEKMLPNDDPSSYYDLLKRNLLDYVNIPPENIHPIVTESTNADVVAEEYKQQLVNHFEFTSGGQPAFDLILLSVGEEGEVAALFMDLEGINDPGRLTIPVKLNRLKHDFVSLSLSLINNAKHVVLLATGTRKAEIAKAVVEEKRLLPASMIHPLNGQLTVLLDHQSARLISYRDSIAHEGQAISISL